MDNRLGKEKRINNSADIIPSIYTIIEYVQINDADWPYAPQRNIFLSQARMDQYVIDHNLKNILKPINRRMMDYNSYRCEVHMDIKNDNFGDIFYLKIDNRYYFAWVDRKTVSGEKLKLTLQIDVVTYVLPFANNNELKGTAYLEQGHLVTREKNTICDNNCNGVQMTNDYYNEYQNNILVSETTIFTNTNMQREVTKNVNTPAQSVAYNLLDLGTAYAVDNFFVAHSPIQSKTITASNLQIRDFVTIEQRYGFRIADENWGSGQQPVTIGIDAFPDGSGGENRSANRQMFDAIQDNSSARWYCLPKLFSEVGDSEIEIFEIPTPSFDFKDHYWKHVAVNLHLGYFFVIPIDIFFIQNRKIYVKRIIASENATFYFYYDSSRKNEFHKIIINIENGKISSNWNEFVRNRSSSYVSGDIANAGLETLGGLSNSLSNLFLINSLSSNKKNKNDQTMGYLSVLPNLLTFPFSLASSYLQNYYNEQDVLKKPVSATNISQFNIIEKMLLSNVYDKYSMYTFTPKPDPAGAFRNIIFRFRESFAAKDGSRNSLSLAGSTISDQDKINLEKSQKMKGNVINLTQEIDNIFAFNNKTNYIFIKAIISPYFLPKTIDNNIFLILNKRLLDGITILINADEWK